MTQALYAHMNNKRKMKKKNKKKKASWSQRSWHLQHHSEPSEACKVWG
jgi:hypothetical protein